MKKYNWRYYVYEKTHVIQHLKYTSLHIEAKTKKQVFKKLNQFIKTQTKKSIHYCFEKTPCNFFY